jgi:hypothetical protein
MNDDDKAARRRDALRRISVVEEILRRWNPIGQLVPADEYDGYAPHIVSMVAQGRRSPPRSRDSHRDTFELLTS